MSRSKSSSVVRALKQNLQEVEQQANNLFELIARDPSLKEAASLPPNGSQPSFDVPPISNSTPLETPASISNATSSLTAKGSSFATTTTTSSTSTSNLFITAAASAAVTTNMATKTAATTITGTANSGGAPLASSFLGLLRTHVTDSIHQANESIDCLAKMDEITEVHQPTIDNVRKLVDTIQEQVAQLSHCYLMSKSTTSMSFAGGRIDNLPNYKNKDALSLYQMSTLQFAEESMNLLTAKILDGDSTSKSTNEEKDRPAWALPVPKAKPVPRNKKALEDQRHFVLNRLKDQSGSMDRQLENMLTTQAEVLKKVLDATKR